MTGPPTPPLSTAAEILDAERNSTASIAETAPLPNASIEPISVSPGPQATLPTEDPYERIFQSIKTCVEQSDFNGVIRVAELGDLNGEGDKHESRFLVTVPLVLCYLIIDDLPPAFHALTRLPDNLTVHPLSKTLMGLLASSWERLYSRVYERAEAFLSLVSQPDFPHQALSSLLATLIRAFLESLRQRAVVALSKAYVTLPISLAQTYLGLSAERVLTVMGTDEWMYDAESKTLSPITVATSTTQYGSSSLVTFHLVSDGISKLET